MNRRHDASVALCPHFSLEHFRGGEKWVTELANRLSAGGVDVSVHALPYAPGGERRVDAADVLVADVAYTEAWHHDLSTYDTAYVFYNPFAWVSFHGAARTVAGIHSWVYVSERLYEAHYGVVPTTVKVLYRLIGRWDLRQFDAVHAVTPAFDSPHPATHYIPNFVDVDRFRPGREPLGDEFTVLVTAAHIPEKGWDTARAVAAALPDDVTLAATGESDHPAVTSLGFLSESELADAYARSHVVLHPSRVDTDSMVINEACASGTPVVTTPLATHVRENEAILHRGSVAGMVDAICDLRGEWRDGTGYEHRCRVARETGEQHAVDRVLPRLERLLLGSPEVGA